jgi:hypothetical protein
MNVSHLCAKYNGRTHVWRVGPVPAGCTRHGSLRSSRVREGGDEIGCGAANTTTANAEKAIA